MAKHGRRRQNQGRQEKQPQPNPPEVTSPESPPPAPVETAPEATPPSVAETKTPAQTATVSGPRKLSRGRKWLYRITAMVLVPALVFGLLELGLRLGGYGDSTDFFVDGSKIEGSEVWIENPQFGRWVFPRHLNPFPEPMPFVLPKSKAAGTYRIFVLGESAARGFPDETTNFARVLEVMLRDRYPDTKFEVINASMVAINSHVVLPIAKQCLAQQPDLLIVHLGNNEVVGPFGAAGVLGKFQPSLRLIRANLAIKTTRTGQLFSRLLTGGGDGDKPAQAFEGMSMFKETQMRPDDDKLPRIRSHYQANLEDICQAAEKAGVPVILCTIPCNLKDCAPFGSLHKPGLDGERLQTWDARYKEGARLEQEKKYQEALGQYAQAAKMDDAFADLAFRQGRCSLALGNQQEAAQHFIRARDLDALRFRSDTDINRIIREIAAARQGAGVRLADAEQAFAKNSPGGIPGDELFLEHVHMTFKGNYLLGQTVFETLSSLPPSALNSAAKEKTPPLSEQECALRLGHTAWSEWKHRSEMHDQLLQVPPFTFQLDQTERNKRWQERVKVLHDRLKKDGYKQAMDDFRKALQKTDGDWMIRFKFAQFLMDGEFMTPDRAKANMMEAIIQYENVLSVIKHHYYAHAEAAQLCLLIGSATQAEEHYRAALKLKPNVIKMHIGLAEALVQQDKITEAKAIYEQQVREHPTSGFVLDAHGVFLARTGKFEEAKSRFEEALRHDPNNAKTHVDLAETLVQLGNKEGAIEHFEAALKIKPDFPYARERLEKERKTPTRPRDDDRNR